MAFLTRFLALVSFLAVAAARTGFIKSAVDSIVICSTDSINDVTLYADVLKDGNPTKVTSMFRMYNCGCETCSTFDDRVELFIEPSATKGFYANLDTLATFAETFVTQWWNAVNGTVIIGTEVFAGPDGLHNYGTATDKLLRQEKYVSFVMQYVKDVLRHDA